MSLRSFPSLAKVMAVHSAGTFLPGCVVAVRYALLLGLALVAIHSSASETPRTVRFDEFAATHVDFSLKDGRPDVERMSFVKEDDGDTVIRLGDDAVTPNVVSLLQHELQAQLGAKLAGRRVVASSVSVSIWMARAGSASDTAYEFISGRPVEEIFGKAIAHPLAAAIDSVRNRKTVVVNVEGEVDEMGFSANVANKFSWSRLTERDIRNTIAEAMQGAAKDAGRWLRYHYAPSVPENYAGPKVKIRDTVIGEAGPHLQQFFCLDKVNERPVNNSFDISQRRAERYGHFEPPTPLERELPVGPVRLEVVGRAARGANPRFDDGVRGVVEFFAEEGKSYANAGEATDDNVSVWIVDQGSGNVLSEKFTKSR